VELPPAEPRPMAEITPALPVASGRIAGLKVLCIDNEPDVLNGMRTLLEGWGCVALTARNAEEASEILDRARTTPDIILADFHLDASTGFEAVADLQAKISAGVPVIIITADHSAEVQREVRARGYALLRKPLKAAALRALMYQLTLQRAVAAE
jgi:CheY-like chemotaxis protein